MNTHVKVLGWLWIINGVLSILMLIAGLIIVNLNVAGSQDALLASVGSVCCFLPGIIAYPAAGYGLLKYQGWARILAIILAIFNLVLFPIGTALGIYTLIIMFNKEAVTLFNSEVAPTEIEEVS